MVVSACLSAAYLRCLRTRVEIVPIKHSGASAMARGVLTVIAAKIKKAICFLFH